MKNSATGLLLVLSVLSVIFTLSRATPRDWLTFGKEIVKYSRNCDFKGSDIEEIPKIKSPSKCIKRCRQQRDCTHFTYSLTTKTCWIKKADQMEENDNQRSYCGFIPGRSSQLTEW